MDTDTLDFYANNATAVASRYESIVNGLATHFDTAFPKNCRVLDVGCGSGRDIALLMRLGHDVYGLDATAELVRLAQEWHPVLRGRVSVGILPECSVPFGGQFDGVLCSAVLMHIPLDQQAATIDFIRRCLKPTGTFLYSVPSQRGDVDTVHHRDAGGRLFIPDTAGRLQAVCEQAGFKLVDQWINADSLGRDEVQWVSVLMRLNLVQVP